MSKQLCVMICAAAMTVMAMTVAACGGEETSADEGTPAAEGAPAETEAAPEAPPEPEPGPAEVAEAYLRAGSAEDSAAITAALDPACADNEAATRVDAMRMMGVPMTIETLEVTVASEEGDAASVAYEVSGSAHGEGGTTQLFGATVQTGAVNIEGASQSGTLALRRIDGSWRVGCGG